MGNNSLKLCLILLTDLSGHLLLSPKEYVQYHSPSLHTFQDVLYTAFNFQKRALLRSYTSVRKEKKDTDGLICHKQLINIMPKEKVVKFTETDTIQSQISSKTSRGKKDSTK